MRKNCTYCGSSKHGDLYMLDGVPPDALFDYVINPESIEDLPRAVEIIKEDQK